MNTNGNRFHEIKSLQNILCNFLVLYLSDFSDSDLKSVFNNVNYQYI